MQTSGQTTPELAFIIVNWNGGDYLRGAVESILLFPPRIGFEILVVDNGSTDGSLAWLRSGGLKERLGPARLRLIENEDNHGFGKANNQAFAATQARLLFLLNPDAELRPGACEVLIAAIEADGAIGACGPRIVNPDGSLQISVWRNPPTAWAILATGLHLHKLLPPRMRGELLLAEHWTHDRRRDVPMLSGAAMLVRRATIEAAGGFDERFDMYGEDNEWCLRMRRGGWRLLFEPAAIVMHHSGRSAEQRWTDAERMRVQLGALFRFQSHALKRRQRIAILLARSLVLALHVARRRLSGRTAEDLSVPLGLYRQELGRALRGRAEALPPGLGRRSVILLGKTVRQAANLVLARRPRFVIVGTGRCGTGYAARRLSGLGIICSHEAYFTPDGPRLRNRWRAFETKGEASGLAPPFLRAGEMPVVHLVRRPQDVIHSLYSIGVFDPEFIARHRVYVDFDARYFEIGSDPFDACLRWYLEWNRRCEMVAGLRVRIEDFEESLPRIFAHIGFAPTRDAEPPARTYNARPSVYPDPPSLAEIERRIGEHPLARELADMAELYGYGPIPRADERRLARGSGSS